MIRALVFDLWNTLVHTREGDPYRHLQKLLDPRQRELFPALKRAAMDRPQSGAREFLEGWREPMGLSEAQLSDMVEVFHRSAAEAEPFPEAVEVLQRCRSLARLGLLSNTQSFDMEFLERLGLAELLPIRHLSWEVGLLKPDPAAFQAIQNHFGLFPGELAMVGDSWTDDVQGALEAGWTAIWINRSGAPLPERDPEAEWAVLPDLSGLPELLERLQAGARCGTCLG